MKRSTALLLALALLVAHILTLHQDGSGRLAAIGEQGHAVMRFARNAVHHGSLAWNVGGPTVDAYPSWAWLAIAVFAERVYWPTPWVLQAMGGLSAMALVFVVSRFSPDRLTGVVAPLLLVVSGSLAAAALSGLEWTAFALVATMAFLAHEAERPRWFAGSLVAAVLLRPEGLALTALLALFELRSTKTDDPRVGWRAFLAPVVTAGLVVAIRRATTGAWFSPTVSDAFRYDPERVRIGLEYLASFTLYAGGPLVAAIATVALVVDPERPRRASRAALLGWSWCLWVAWNGGDEGAFWIALTPALPALYLAVQGVVTRSVDSDTPLLRSAGWTLFVVGSFAAMVASKLPGNLGPIPLGDLHRSWMGAGERRVADGLDVGIARLGEHESLGRVERLRTIGIFLRDEAQPEISILSPWPGAVGYLSRRRLYDLGGRVVPAPGATTTRSWFGPRRTDVLAALRRQPDYILPSMQLDTPLETPAAVVDDWLTRYDTEPRTPAREAAALAALDPYELIAVPVAVDSRRPHLTANEPIILLRHERLGLAPELTVARDGLDFSVTVRHRGHREIVDVMVEFTPEGDGAREGAMDGDAVLTMRPTGEFGPRADVRARTKMLLYASGRREVELLRGRMPGAGSLRARLLLTRFAGEDRATDR